MKHFKGLFLLLIVSVLCMTSGVLAIDKYRVYNTLQLATKAGYTYGGAAQKDDSSVEVLRVGSVTDNRKICAQITAIYATESLSTTMKCLNNVPTKKTYLLDYSSDEGYKYASQDTGPKQIQIKTKGKYDGYTYLGGSWWTSSNDYDKVYGLNS